MSADPTQTPAQVAVQPPDDAHSSILPTLRYRNLPAAVDWLCEAFGFRRHLLTPGAGKPPTHAQLTLGAGMVMLGVADQDDAEYAKHVKHPDEVGGVETQSPYLVVADADAVHARVKAQGGQIVVEIRDEPYGGRGFTCRDLEGRQWSVGTYDPWAVNTPVESAKPKR